MKARTTSKKTLKQETRQPKKLTIHPTKTANPTAVRKARKAKATQQRTTRTTSTTRTT